MTNFYTFDDLLASREYPRCNLMHNGEKVATGSSAECCRKLRELQPDSFSTAMEKGWTIEIQPNVAATPIPLVEKYQPETLDGFAGMERARKLLNHLAANPYSSAWLFTGPSGLGKTTMALALAKQIGGELHHIPSSKCDKASVDDICHQCWYVPMGGGFHVVLVDEADQMSHAAQLAFLSKLDATAAPPNTIWIFTANDTANLKDRFISRCRRVQFTADGLTEPAVGLLSRIWRAESNAPLPDVLAILKEAGNNIRQALMTLEMELITA